MTKPISIPVADNYNPPHPFKQPHIAITPEVARQIVALAGTPKDKDAAVAWCRRAYPGVDLLASERCRVPHDGKADALCIAEYGRRMFK